MILVWLGLVSGAVFLGLFLFTSNFLPPAHEDLAVAYRHHPNHYERCAELILAGKGTSRRDNHVGWEIPSELAADGISVIVRKGPCVFFEAQGIPMYSEGIVFCPSPNPEGEVRKQGPPTEEHFVALKPLASRWLSYTTD